MVNGHFFKELKKYTVTQPLFLENDLNLRCLFATLGLQLADKFVLARQHGVHL